MNVKIVASTNFRKEAKKLLKKYASLKKEFASLNKELQNNPYLGDSIGKKCYKIRLAVKSKGKGKSGGLRVITYVVVKVKKVNSGLIKINLISTYDKSEYESISDKDLIRLIKEVEQEENEEQ